MPKANQDDVNGENKNDDQGRLKINMYQTVIYFKDDLSEEMLEALRVLCDQAFDNRGGKASLSENSLPPFCLIYEGEEELFCCMQMANVDLSEVEGFRETIKSWHWIDENPGENHDILAALSIPVYMGD